LRFGERETTNISSRRISIVGIGLNPMATAFMSDGCEDQGNNPPHFGFGHVSPVSKCAVRV
jgi:hypothetical protein